MAENALSLDMIERELLTPGMTSGQLADAVLTRLGLEIGKYTVVAKEGTPGVVFIQPKTRPTNAWADQPAEAVIEMCRGLWR